MFHKQAGGNFFYEGFSLSSYVLDIKGGNPICCHVSLSIAG